MEQLVIVKAKDQAAELIKYISKHDIFAFDTESTGLDEDADIIGFSICAEPNVAYYVILKKWDKEQQKLINTSVESMALMFMEALKDKQLVMHNAIFDCRLVKRCFQVDLMPVVIVDTLMLSHLLDENRSNKLKDLGETLFGQNAKVEQKEMAESVARNGGISRINEKSSNIEIYKADADLIAKYGAKDALLTYNLMIVLLEELKNFPDLWSFFFDEESMPLLKGPTYTMNDVGLKLDLEKLTQLGTELQAEIIRLEENVLSAIKEYVKEVYPCTTHKNKFNINSSDQLSWLLFIRLGLEFKRLTPKGRELSKQLIGELPYTVKAKRAFIQACKAKELKPEKYIMADKSTLDSFKNKFSWIADLLEYKRLSKLLSTYVEGIKERAKYGIIKPSFLQHGTTSGRYSSQNPNFQNLPRDDKRVKSCIVARPGKVFIGADYAQLEPRVFASFSQDIELLHCFEKDQDFYSVIGMKAFDINDCTPHKEGEDSFAKKHKGLRQIAKTIALSVTYGTTAFKMVDAIKRENGDKFTIEECQKIIDDYLEAFPGVKAFMDKSHKTVVATGVVKSLFGRARRIPEAKQLRTYGNFKHDRLPYHLRNHLNLAVNHQIQSTAASIINRSAIALHNELQNSALDAKIVLQVHDSLVVECLEQDAPQVANLMQQCMENTVSLKGVKLIAEPKIGRNLADV